MDVAVGRGRALIVVALAMATLLLALSAARASAADVTKFDGGVFDAGGVAVTQAGTHPYIGTTTLEFSMGPGGLGQIVDASIKDARVDLPLGFVGNPSSLPKCGEKDLIGHGSLPTCPFDSQVGLVTVVPGAVLAPAYYPVFNMVPPPGKAAAFGFNISGVLVHATGRVRPDDHGITVDVENADQSLALSSTTMTLWGVPQDPSHDIQRCYLLRLIDGAVICDIPVGGGQPTGEPHAATVRARAFLTNPVRCTGEPLITKLRAAFWPAPDDIKTASFLSHDNGTPPSPVSVTGCDKVPFVPQLSVSPSTSRPDSPSGLSVDLAFDQDGTVNPKGIASAHLKDATVTLPEGMTINPASAAGLQACADAQAKLASDEAVSCPDGSKIGTVTAVTPLLDELLEGGVYLRPQASDDPASGDMFRIMLNLVNKARGIDVKLAGRIAADPATGRLTTRFANQPQLPVSNVKVAFKSGSRAPLVTPSACGKHTIDADLTSWSGQSAHRESTFTVDCPAGLGGFSPSFSAGTVNPAGGAFSPFTLGIVKPDGQRDLTGLTMELPTGLLANLKGNLGTQVGSVTAFAGPGSSPFALPGKVFLEGAYGEAPFSLKVVVPAKAGPFDLGEVVVRQKLYVDPNDAHVTVVSDPLPTIVKGVPVRLQRLDVNVDKAGFIINPTSCAPTEVKGTLASVAGQTVAVTNRFQVECASLGYEPELSMTMTGKGQTKDGSHPALHARLVPPANNANTKKATVTLPLSLALDPGNANGLCEPVDAARNACPAKSIVGSAQAESVLPDTLKGSVYFVRGERIENGKVRKTLPKLFIPLSANGVTVYLHASSNAVDDRLVTTFDNLPDAPFSSFDLNINGGEHGILAVSNANTCAANNIAEAEFGGQNGKSSTSKVTMGTPCALGIVKSSHTSTALKVTVGGLGAGKVSASGKGVTKSSRSLASATTATLSLKLSKATRRALTRGRDVKVKVKVAFTAKGTKKAKTATKTVTIHGAKKR